MAPEKRMPRILKEKMEISNDFDAELQLIPAVEKAEEQILTVEEQNEVMAKALHDIFDLYMVFDYPKGKDFGTIAQHALEKVGHL